jgi:hypothetical protein
MLKKNYFPTLPPAQLNSSSPNPDKRFITDLTARATTLVSTTYFLEDRTYLPPLKLILLF